VAGKREKSKAARMARIVDAARAMINESGDVGLSMRALAERSEVSLMTLYNLLGSRQAVLLQVLVEDIRSARNTYEGRQYRDPIDALFGIIPLIRSNFERNIPYWNAVILSLFQSGAEQIRRVVREENLAVWRRVLVAAAEQSFLRTSIDIDSLLILLDNVSNANNFSLAAGDIDHDVFEARGQYGFALILAGAVSRPHVQRVRGILDKWQARRVELEPGWTHSPVE
jgi:AcrR family transcriptional regulator